MSEEAAPRKPKPRMPKAIRERADLAKARMADKWTAPGFVYEGGPDNPYPVSPFSDKDRRRWTALLAEALGTRSVSVIETFLNQLMPLCNDKWEGPERGWEPNPKELNTLLAICAAAQPEDEMQAGIVVQMCGLHISAMKLAAVSGRSWGGCERSASAQARVSKTYANLARTLAQLQGKATRHEQHFHYHDERHVHMGGGSQIGGQPQAVKEIDLVPQSNGGGGNARRAALPGPRTDAIEAMPSAGRQRQARVPNAWGWAWIRRTLGRG